MCVSILNAIDPLHQTTKTIEGVFGICVNERKPNQKKESVNNPNLISLSFYFFFTLFCVPIVWMRNFRSIYQSCLLCGVYLPFKKKRMKAKRIYLDPYFLYNTLQKLSDFFLMQLTETNWSYKKP